MRIREAITATMMLSDSRVHLSAAQKNNYYDPSIGHEHVAQMYRTVLHNEMSEGKLNRWLGWVQASICSWGIATLDEMKEINRVHSIEGPKTKWVVMRSKSSHSVHADTPMGVFETDDLARAYIQRRKINNPNYSWQLHSFVQNKGGDE
jgi:hypothetical protein